MVKKKLRKISKKVKIHIHSDTHIAGKVVQELTQFERQFKNKMGTLIISAFGLVAALMWNDAIKEFLTTLVPEQELLLFKIVAALSVTVIAVLITVALSWTSSNKDSSSK